MSTIELAGEERHLEHGTNNTDNGGSTDKLLAPAVSVRSTSEGLNGSRAGLSSRGGLGKTSAGGGSAGSSESSGRSEVRAGLGDERADFGEDGALVAANVGGKVGGNVTGEIRDGESLRKLGDDGVELLSGLSEDGASCSLDLRGLGWAQDARRDGGKSLALPDWKVGGNGAWKLRDDSSGVNTGNVEACSLDGRELTNNSGSFSADDGTELTDVDWQRGCERVEVLRSWDSGHEGGAKGEESGSSTHLE